MLSLLPVFVLILFSDTRNNYNVNCFSDINNQKSIVARFRFPGLMVNKQNKRSNSILSGVLFLHLFHKEIYAGKFIVGFLVLKFTGKSWKVILH